MNKTNHLITHAKGDVPVMKSGKDNRTQQELEIHRKMQEYFQQKCVITRTRLWQETRRLKTASRCKYQICQKIFSNH